MIGTYSMTTDTKFIAEKISDAIESTKTEMSKELRKITDHIYDGLVEKFSDHFAYDNENNYLETIAYEVRQIMRNLLVGDINQIKQLNIISEYTFDRLHEIRLKIWETCSKEIESCIISEQNKKIEELRKQIQMYENRNNY
jgi:hypothetical protein